MPGLGGAWLGCFAGMRGLGAWFGFISQGLFPGFFFSDNLRFRILYAAKDP